jgi:hypothetical protein
VNSVHGKSAFGAYFPEKSIIGVGELARKGCTVPAPGICRISVGVQHSSLGCSIAQLGCSIAQLGCSIAQLECSIAQLGCSIAQWLARWTVDVQSRVRFSPSDC